MFDAMGEISTARIIVTYVNLKGTPWTWLQLTNQNIFNENASEVS